MKRPVFPYLRSLRSLIATMLDLLNSELGHEFTGELINAIRILQQQAGEKQLTPNREADEAPLCPGRYPLAHRLKDPLTRLARRGREVNSVRLCIETDYFNDQVTGRLAA